MGPAFAASLGEAETFALFERGSEASHDEEQDRPHTGSRQPQSPTELSPHRTGTDVLKSSNPR